MGKIKMTLTRHVTSEALRKANIIAKNESLSGAKKIRNEGGEPILVLTTVAVRHEAAEVKKKP